ncbi:MAG: LacI family DNA-binding transcriptional regulator [Oscillospiraceae bacterium]|nr:LacI family DNA-binding transcriptional regulator [Oscillospiraceae bacterium]
MGITAKELAKKLGLSEAAVSIALNHKPGVSTATKQRVLEAAEKYGYDFTRVSTKRGGNGSIFMVIYKKHGAVVGDSPFFSELIDSIQKACKEEGYPFNTRYLYEEDDVSAQIEDLVYSACSGIILLGTEMRREDFRPFESIRIPLVLLDVYFDSVKRDCVLINNVQGAFLATDYLIRHTKKQPGYLRSYYSISNFEERADGFYNAIRQHGYSASKSVVHKLSPSIEGAYSDMLEIIDSGEALAPCYFADNDMIALGAMKALQQRGYSIPKDISIIGFDNISLCNYASPSLTTVNVPKTYMGETAVHRLVEIMKAKSFVPVKIEVMMNLVKRQSV